MRETDVPPGGTDGWTGIRETDVPRGDRVASAARCMRRFRAGVTYMALGSAATGSSRR